MSSRRDHGLGMLKCISTAGSVLAAAANCSRILSHHHYLYHAQSFRGPHTVHLSLAGFAPRYRLGQTANVRH